MSLFFGEKAGTVSDKQSLVPGAGLIDPRKVDFVQDAMAQGEPHTAMQVKGSSHATLCARSPPWRNSRPAGCEPFYLAITHLGSLRCIA